MNAWEKIADAISHEFSDLDDIGMMATVCFRLVLAGILGGILGYERESKGKAAGLRTHMLVALGTAVFVLVPQLYRVEADAMSRVIQGVTAGVGFLGAGAIVKGQPGQEIHGLTTAAGIWMTAAIGVAAGIGRAATAIISTLLALAVLRVLCHGVGWLHANQSDTRCDTPAEVGGRAGADDRGKPS